MKRDMIFYCKRSGKNKEKLLSAVEEVYPENKTIVCSSLDIALSLPVWKPVNNDIFLLLIEESLELNDLSAYTSLLLQCKLILVLPDKMTETISLACKYQPIYMADLSGDLQDMKDVIKKNCNRPPNTEPNY